MTFLWIKCVDQKKIIAKAIKQTKRFAVVVKQDAYTRTISYKRENQPKKYYVA